MNILYIADSPNQGGAFWRSTGPFTHLRNMMYGKEDYRFQFKHAHPQEFGAEKVQWDSVSGSDVVFMHRPFTEDHKRIVALCNDLQVPLWLDFDDLLTNIPYDNKTHSQYMDAKTQQRIIEMILAADCVTVSTYELKRQLDRFRPKKDCLILRNAIEPRDFGWRQPQAERKIKRVVWRGSEHHQKDLLHVKDDIIRVAKKFKDIEFAFVGFKPWFIMEEIENTFTVAPMDIMAYFRCLHYLHPQLVIAPLFDNVFNRCKSNIAGIEAGIACGTIIAPNWEEWNCLDGAIPYTNFGETLEEECQKLMDKNSAHETMATDLWYDIEANFDLDTWNDKRRIILDDLVHDEADTTIDELANTDCLDVYGKTQVAIMEEKFNELGKAVPPGSGKTVEQLPPRRGDSYTDAP